MTQYPWGSAWDCTDPRVSRVLADLGGVEWVGSYGSGPCFLLQRLDGWWGGGSVAGGAVPWESADGASRGDVHLHSRIVTLRGLILSESGADQFEMFDELAAVWATGRWQTLIVDEPERGITRQLTVAPSALPAPQPISDLVASVSVTVESDGYPLLDVVQQSATLTTAGVTMRNEGTYRAYPVVSLVGPLTNPGLSWPGGAWTYSGTIPSGTTITVDMGARRVSDLATTIHSRNLAGGDWLGLPGGDTLVKRTGTGSGSITAKWRSAWH